uniref:Uncharacterized protein n=1 Tax=Branchiostoma floridae TaxID=7739 RepID=C3Y1I2_BRAFL|eukprot:XP_002609712.1 hypothetical protein BRAFLDRAFT_102476 [Branchiostoma floridae]
MSNDVLCSRAGVDLPPVFGNVSHTRQKTAGDRAEGLMGKIRGRADRAAFPGANSTMHKSPAVCQYFDDFQITLEKILEPMNDFGQQQMVHWVKICQWFYTADRHE